MLSNVCGFVRFRQKNNSGDRPNLCVTRLQYVHAWTVGSKDGLWLIFCFTDDPADDVEDFWSLKSQL